MGREQSITGPYFSNIPRIVSLAVPKGMFPTYNFTWAWFCALNTGSGVFGFGVDSLTRIALPSKMLPSIRARARSTPSREANVTRANPRGLPRLSRATSTADTSP